MTVSPGLARVAATQETNFPLPHPSRSAECGVWSAECTSWLPSSIPHSALRTPHSALDCLDNLFGRPVQSLHPIRPHEPPPQLHRLDHRAHGDERRDELGELLVVMHRVGLA